ncbi:hypothetical protein [Haloarcula sp. Atlit-7R]|uniref:hypothetical protein n=1 Tax=Haloarcula sp. Atlit-7R TaxID=2282125 RepID=UPI000EF13332|nr:hypothetical protein [Haloarcula sp. Atlit-7R]RLM94358.1 hypothetical protein D3D01_15970 [Haloarcula sp. Atlit-7R]
MAESYSDTTNGFGSTKTQETSIQDCLEVISPTRRKDYKAVVINDVSPTEQAEQRGVYPSTVSENVRRGHQQVEQHLREQGIITGPQGPGYTVDIHSVGGREPDGSPAAVSKWTFETSAIRTIVEDAIQGRTLNACAGETHLTSGTGTIIRNDLNPERPAEYHQDICDLENGVFEERSFDSAILDPPFDPQNADKHYEGWHAGDLAAARENLSSLIKPGGVVVELGWNSHDLSKASDSWERTELHLFYRGPCLPDIFLTVSQKTQMSLF